MGTYKGLGLSFGHSLMDLNGSFTFLADSQTSDGTQIIKGSDTHLGNYFYMIHLDWISLLMRNPAKYGNPLQISRV